MSLQQEPEQVLVLEPAWVLVLARVLVWVLVPAWVQVLVPAWVQVLVGVLIAATSQTGVWVCRFLESKPARLAARLVRWVFRHLVVACAH
ncbi:hypothetical protein [Schaalia turicensis]|uniref:hypothetical protein n=1 Tax=Schaalia turicensis TaxID=131111 RepID=UPI0034A26DF8